ncbi:hypothetical protein KKH56_01550 [bacterium]|nr:hypothetical protein [bacterium]
MYAIIEKNKIHISVAEFYDGSWYGKDWPLAHEEKFKFEYGNLEIDVHKNSKRYLTGFAMDPRIFIVDYLKTCYKKDFSPPKKIDRVSVDTGRHVELLSIDFLKGRSFVVDGMEKDLIFPQFTRQGGHIKIQGFEVLDIFSLLNYLIGRFKYKATTRVRKGDTVYDLKTGRRWKIKRKKVSKG